MERPLVITRGRRLTLAAGLPLTLAVIVLLTLNLLGRISPTSTGIDTVFPMQGTSLAIRVDAGDLTFVATTGDQVTVSGLATSSFASPRLLVSGSGSATALSLACAPLPGPCSLTAKIAVPEGVRVTAADDSGTLAASGFRQGVHLSTDSGDIQVHDLGGDVTLGTDSGSISGSGLTSSATTVNSDSGDVSLGFAAAPERIQVDEDSGDILLVVPDRSYQVSARSISGDITIDVPQNPSSHNVISARTDSGDIHIRP